MKKVVLLVILISAVFSGCASGPSELPSEEQISKLSLDSNTGTYVFKNNNYNSGEISWFIIQPSMSGELVVENYGRDDLTAEIYNNNHRLARYKLLPRRLVISSVEKNGSYLFKVKNNPWYISEYGQNISITAFVKEQREEIMRLAEEEKNRVEAERAEASRQAQIARQEQEQAEQVRLANLYRQAGNNVGNFGNTSKSHSSQSSGALYMARYDFGDGNYILEAGYPGGDYLFGMGTSTGTFRVNGDIVIFLSSEGEYSHGTILGNTLTVGDRIFR